MFSPQRQGPTLPAVPAEKWPHAELNDLTIRKRRLQRKKLIALGLIVFLFVLVYSTKLILPLLQNTDNTGEKEIYRPTPPVPTVPDLPPELPKIEPKPVVDMPSGWNEPLWGASWNSEQKWLNFTASAWEKLSFAEKRRKARAYQKWYAEKRGLPVEKNFVAAGESFAMVLIPPGKFWRGHDVDIKLSQNESPRHKTLLTQPFWLGKYEVTQQQWYAVTKMKPWLLTHMVRDNPWLQQEFVRDNPTHAASCLSYVDIHEKFLPRLGKQFDLPSETEWEYACRAGSDTMFHWGEEDLPNLNEWHIGNASKVGQRYAHPVGMKNPNTWGLYDMGGNLSEWCKDWFSAYTGAELTNPLCAVDSQNKIYRGGNWSDINYRSSARFYSAPSSRYLFLGCRLRRQAN